MLSKRMDPIAYINGSEGNPVVQERLASSESQELEKTKVKWSFSLHFFLVSYEWDVRTHNIHRKMHDLVHNFLVFLWQWLRQQLAKQLQQTLRQLKPKRLQLLRLHPQQPLRSQPQQPQQPQQPLLPQPQQPLRLQPLQPLRLQPQQPLRSQPQQLLLRFKLQSQTPWIKLRTSR